MWEEGVRQYFSFCVVGICVGGPAVRVFGVECGDSGRAAVRGLRVEVFVRNPDFFTVDVFEPVEPVVLFGLFDHFGVFVPLGSVLFV